MLAALITKRGYVTIALPKWKEGHFYFKDPDNGKDLFEISPSKEKQFILAENVDHNYLFFNEENHQHIIDWLNQKFE